MVGKAQSEKELSQTEGLFLTHSLSSPLPCRVT